MHTDRQIAVWGGWIAGPAFGVAMMAAPEYLHLKPAFAATFFWGGILIFVVTVFAVAVLQSRERERRRKPMWPIIAMAVGVTIFGTGAAGYFWPGGGRFTFMPTAVNVIAVTDGDRVDLIVFVRADNGYAENVTARNWQLIVETPSGKSAITDAVHVLEPTTWNFVNGQPPFMLTPEASLVGKTEFRYALGETTGRILFRVNGVTGAEANDEATKLSLQAKIDGKPIKSAVVSMGQIKAGL